MIFKAHGYFPINDGPLTSPKFEFLDFCWIFSKNDTSTFSRCWIFMQNSEIAYEIEVKNNL